jgi:outer membrane protein insertion porin family
MKIQRKKINRVLKPSKIHKTNTKAILKSYCFYEKGFRDARIVSDSVVYNKRKKPLKYKNQ